MDAEITRSTMGTSGMIKFGITYEDPETGDSIYRIEEFEGMGILHARSAAEDFASSLANGNQYTVEELP